MTDDSTKILTTPEFDREEYAAKVRKVIADGLAGLADDFNSYEQTTHGVHVHECGIGAVLQSIRRTYVDPKAFTISDMVQIIRQWCREESERSK